MDLMTLQNQLKVAIQNHQITVAKMKGEPQNSGLQKQLNELQQEIVNLSEKQKQVIQQLRKDLEKKEGPGCVIAGTQFPATTATVASRLLLSASTQSALQLHRPTTLTVPPLPLGSSTENSPSSSSVAATFASSPAAQHIIRQVVPSLVNNLVAAATGNVAFKTPIAAAVLLPSAATNAVFATSTTPHSSAKGAENKTPVGSAQQSSAPVLVVPSPGLCSQEVSTSTQSSLLVNLAPPIRVPQYPPIISKPSPCQNSTGPVPISVSTTSLDVKEQKPVFSTHNKSHSCSTKVASNTVTRASIKPKLEDEKKMSFLGSLGLVSKITLNELQNKKVERKRRTTANPHFSNAAVEERKRHAAATALLQQAAGPLHHHHHHNRFHGPFKRPRGRPRLNPTPGSSRPSTPESTGSPSPRNSPPSSVTIALPPLTQHHQEVLTQTEEKPVPAATEQQTSPSISLLPLASISPPSTIGIKVSTTPSTITAIAQPASALKSQTVLALSGLPQVLNGCLKPLAIRNGVAGERSCSICGLLVLMRLPTDGATCQHCKALAHTHCVSVGAKNSSQYYPGKPWSCPKCTKEILIVKEEERQRLLKRRQDLSTEQGRLKEKLKQLGQVAISQQKRHKEMMAFQQRMQMDVKRILDVVCMVQQCPSKSETLLVSTTTTTPKVESPSAIKAEVESPS